MMINIRTIVNGSSRKDGIIYKLIGESGGGERGGGVGGGSVGGGVKHDGSIDVRMH